MKFALGHHPVSQGAGGLIGMPVISELSFANWFNPQTSFTFATYLFGEPGHVFDFATVVGRASRAEQMIGVWYGVLCQGMQTSVDGIEPLRGYMFIGTTKDTRAFRIGRMQFKSPINRRGCVDVGHGHVATQITQSERDGFLVREGARASQAAVAR